MMDDIEKRICQLEKKVADLEERVQGQPGIDEIAESIEDKLCKSMEAVNEKAFHIPKE